MQFFFGLLNQTCIPLHYSLQYYHIRKGFTIQPDDIQWSQYSFVFFYSFQPFKLIFWQRLVFCNLSMGWWNSVTSHEPRLFDRLLTKSSSLLDDELPFFVFLVKVLGMAGITTCSRVLNQKIGNPRSYVNIRIFVQRLMWHDLGMISDQAHWFTNDRSWEQTETST